MILEAELYEKLSAFACFVGVVPCGRSVCCEGVWADYASFFCCGGLLESGVEVADDVVGAFFVCGPECLFEMVVKFCFGLRGETGMWGVDVEYCDG